MLREYSKSDKPSKLPSNLSYAVFYPNSECWERLEDG